MGKNSVGKNKGKAKAAKQARAATPWGAGSVRAALTVGPGFRLNAVAPDVVTLGPDDATTARAELAALEAQTADLHEQLWAEARTGGTRALLLVLQGMDTSGKGGATKAFDRLLDPNGFSVVGFGVPTAEEKARGYLWRHEQALPEAGRVRVFDRSHYEAVLVERVHGLVPDDVWRARYDEINAWEAELVSEGITVVKCMLHISAAEQKERLAARLDDPTKHYKYNPGDVDERELWDEYQVAYQDALVRCSTDAAPWFVIPADHKWHRDWLLGQILLETLQSMDLAWPVADFDVAAEKKRVAES